MQSHFGVDLKGMKGERHDILTDPVKMSLYSYYCGVWFSDQHKDYLTRVLDEYKSASEIPAFIIMPVHVGDRHWISITISLDRGCSGVVQSVDYGKKELGKEDSEYISRHRMHIAKFFGMYMEQHHVGKEIY